MLKTYCFFQQIGEAFGYKTVYALALAGLWVIEWRNGCAGLDSALFAYAYVWHVSRSLPSDRFTILNLAV